MPKEKPSSAFKLKQLVTDFGENIFSTDSKILFCKVCEIKVASEKRFSIVQHINTEKHKASLIRFQKNNERKNLQQLMPTTSKKSDFNLDLCRAMLAANIPLNKLANPQFKSFLTKYTGQNIPVESTLRIGYIDDCYTEKMNEIKKLINGKKIWISMDETTDIEGRYIVNTIIGILSHDGPGEIFLINVEELDKTNHSTICKAFDRSLFLIWPEGLHYNDVLLFLTDAAPYMKKAARHLQVFYTKMVHVTCLAHALHRVAEDIRSHFPVVDDLVANVKKIFRKSPHRLQIFKTLEPDLALPPEPILTRWGTWISAAIYYCKHFESIKNVVESFDSNDSVAIKKAQDVLKSQTLQANLIYIKSNFECLPTAIKQLQEQKLSLFDSIKITETISGIVKKLQGQHSDSIKTKLDSVLNSNAGYKMICKISKILSGEEESMTNLGLPEDMTLDDVSYFKYAPITSTDVERSFSKYKNLVTDNRRSLKLDNIKKSLIVQCNSNF